MEAMACETPCIVTDVGDAADIVADTGWVVSPRDPVALAGAIEVALRELQFSDSGTRGRECRVRVVEQFALDRMVAGYTELWGRAANA
jgi:glycosyltransferase involved in cell wall biosynthesis